MKTLKIFTVLLCFLLVANFSFGQKKQKKDMELTAKVVEKYNGNNPNIKGGVPTEDIVKKQENEVRSVAGSGPYNCRVYVQNYSGYTIHVYIDGYFAGTMGAYGDLTVNTGNGYTTLYGISAGGTREWNTAGNCSYDYTFKLKD